MPYDRSKDTNPTNAALHQTGLGRRAVVVTPSDTVDIEPYPKGVAVTVAGDLVVLPTHNDDADTVTFTGAHAGFVPPFQVRRVLANGNTASVVAIYD